MSVLVKGVSKLELMKALVQSTSFLPNDIEIIEVPTPHGRLIDADEQIKIAKKWIPHPDAYIEKRNADIVYYLEQADTVIEAEE